MDIGPPILVREVDPSEPWDEVVNEAKALTWTHRCEHALLRVDGGQLLLVRGGTDVVSEVLDGKVVVMVSGQPRHVTLLAWHTHPRPTGPSDHDRMFLRMLRQADSMLYEMFGDANGTRYRESDPEVSQ